MFETFLRVLAASALLATLVATGGAAAQPPAATDPPAADVATPQAEEATAAPQVFDDPYSAYDAGSWEQALQGFVDEQVENPEDPEVALNLGNVHYEMKNYEDAERAFSEAAMSADNALRGEALYNLGNSAYRQGRLEEAVEFYKRALEHDTEDEDAKFNLEFVRDEIRRRHEENKKRQEEGDQQQQQQGDQQQQDDQQQQGDQQGDPPQDSDGDGLSDELERSAKNPTDPENPDTDGDGIPDGQEDQNHNGQVDEDETDPNKADSDGDGIPDGEETPQPGEQQGTDGEQPAEDQEGLTPEEAERYLKSLEEGVPQQRRKLPPGSRRTRPEKDW